MPGRRSGVALLWLLSAAAAADQGGTPFWTSGQYASQAAVPSSPGWSASLTGYGYTGHFDGPLRLRSGAAVAVDARERTPTLSVEIGYASEAKLLGGQPFVGISAGVGANATRYAVLGPFKSRVAAIGPDLSAQFSVGRQQWQASLRGYAEFWARNRFEGYALFAVLSGTLD